MKVSRDWFTPLALGAFSLLAVTGVLMFFHADSGLNKPAHEWLSWLLLFAVAGHALANFASLRRHFAATRTRVVVAAFALVLGASFLPLGGRGDGGGEPPFAGVVHALARAPLPVVAQVAGVTEATLRERLRGAGVALDDAAPSIEAAVGGGLRVQLRALRAAVGAPG